jgi:PAS domain S-box-containing protein
MEAGRSVIDLRMTKLGQVLCFVGAGLGALGILAWLLRMDRVLTVIPGLPPMMPNSAVGLLLLGIAGMLVLQVQSGRMQRLLPMLAAIVVLFISIGTVVEYALGTNLFLVQLAPDRVGPYYPSPSSPPTAIALALLASGVLLWDAGFGKRFRPSEWLILAAALIAITALLGYLYGASPAYRVTGPPIAGVLPTSMRLIRVAGDLLIIGVSFSSAVSLFLISAGLFLGRPDWGTMQIVAGPGPGGLFMRRLMPVVILGPIGFGVIASRIPGAGDNPVVLAGLTDGTTILSLFVMGINALRLDRAFDALEYARKRTRDLIDLASDGIVIADLDGRLAEVNEAVCRLHGYSREELLTKKISDLIPPEDEERLWGHRAQLLEGHSDVGEWIAVRKDRSRFPVEVSAKILPDGRWQGIVRDISERKRTEEALRLSEAAAKQATKARDDMLAVVAHDLRNPLMAISALAMILQKGAERDVGDEIAIAAGRMNRLIHDLIDLTLLEAGTFAIKQEPIPTSDFLSGVVASQAPLASSASLTLRLDAAPDLSEMWADHDRLLQVFENLVGNAIKFTDVGGEITIGAKAGDGEILFSVADTGSGIADSDLPHLFDRFWQGPKVTRRGAGLGLSVVKGIVEAHGGRVWVKSSLGQGSTFFFTIPTVAKANSAT